MLAPDMVEPIEITQEGLLFGRFQVLDLAGRGRHADVFMVRQPPSQDVMALKVLRSPTPDLSERLYREGAIQSQLGHPNVAQVHEVIHEGDEVGLLMEYVDGPALEELLKPGQPWRLGEALGLFRQLLAALSYAHKAGVVHRDLTPANVLLYEDERGEMSVKIIDFGFAKRNQGAEDWETDDITQVGMSIGTPGYVAPEQHKDASTVEERADVFSLGAILYELVCGRPAFPRLPNLVDTVQAAMACEFDPVDEIVPDCPFQVVAAIERALSRDRHHRFESCDEFSLALYGELLDQAQPAVRLSVGRREEAAEQYLREKLDRAIQVLDEEFQGTRSERVIASISILVMFGVIGLAVWRVFLA